ncbi:MAG: pyrimidine operon attenuation protein/uracil phosphoribosyltransferase [Patiriisocius sp.]|jgi:pyrimidine operon attenuation protein/uracil phosphoribosyltransferase
MNKRTIVLDNIRINRIIQRFAHQLIEDFYNEKSLVIIGISGRGKILAERISEELSKCSSIKVQTGHITINKENPYEKEPSLSFDEKSLHNKVVILIDDVLNSGRTLMHSLCHIMKSQVKQVATIVLVDRIHRQFPVKADYVGLTLSTNLKEHVSVEFNKNNDMAYLS